MKKLISILFIFIIQFSVAQEIFANVQINAQQMGGSNQQVYKTLEKSLRDFINTTSWTGKKLQNFEKIKVNFAMVISERSGNLFKGALVVQSVRPVYGSTYESPILNINDTKLAFEYVENENLIFNERQFSGKNLTDLFCYYIYMILGYDADTFQSMTGTQWYSKAQQIAQNAQNRGFEGWSQTEGPKSRLTLASDLLSSNQNQLRSTYYLYHRAGLDNLYSQDQTQAKKVIFDSLMALKQYENSFQQNYAFNIFIDTKSDEIFNIFNEGNNGAVNINELKQLMTVFSPRFIDSKWNKWK